VLEKLFTPSAVAGKGVAWFGLPYSDLAFRAAQFGAERVTIIGPDQDSLVSINREITSQGRRARMFTVAGDMNNLDSIPAGGYDLIFTFDAGSQQKTLGPMFKEMRRLARPGATILVVAAANVGIFHTTCSNPTETSKERAKFAASVTKYTAANVMQIPLKFGVRRAGLHIKNGKVALMHTNPRLADGEQIWLMSETEIRPARYHHFAAYGEASRAVKLEQQSVTGFAFANEAALRAHNNSHEPEKFSPEFVTNPPYLLAYYLVPRN